MSEQGKWKTHAKHNEYINRNIYFTALRRTLTTLGVFNSKATVLTGRSAMGGVNSLHEAD